MHLSDSFIVLLILIPKIKPNTVVVSTYNLWNVMFNWEIRKLIISKMIKQSSPDVIAFQEVRCSNDENENQIKELQKLLPGYKWSFFKSANRVQQIKHSIHKQYNREGIGVLSKLPIVSTVSEELPYKYGPDTNKRLLLHVKLLQGDQYINVINVHFSYDRQQQCGNAAAVLDYVFRKRLQNVIILGDFNIYNDFEPPILMMTLKPGMSFIGCKLEQREIGNRFILLEDSWLKTGLQQDKGLTFSNMPSPGLESRPDRIIIESNMKVESASLSGQGDTYRHQYSSGIVLHRYRTVLNHAALSYHAVTGYSCLHDCGPHGSCRCGVCVAVGNEKTCELLQCEECNSDTYIRYIILLCFVVLSAIHLFYSVLSILIAGANFRGESIYTILGFNCCLLNPDLYKKPLLVTRRSKFLRMCSKWPLFRLPPCYLFAVSALLFVFIVISAKLTFVSTFKSINSILDEEYFPSDHLMLTVKLKY